MVAITRGRKSGGLLIELTTLSVKSVLKAPKSLCEQIIISRRSVERVTTSSSYENRTDVRNWTGNRHGEPGQLQLRLQLLFDGVLHDRHRDCKKGS